MFYLDTDNERPKKKPIYEIVYVVQILVIMLLASFFLWNPAFNTMPRVSLEEGFDNLVNLRFWANYKSRSKGTPCLKICKVNQIPDRAVKKFTSLSLDSESDALFVHFHVKNLSSLKPPENTDILDPVNLVWVESITAPFLSLDLDFNVYSLTALWRKVRNMSVMVDFESSKCLHNISYSCMTASLATAFLTNVSHQRGALCYVIKADIAMYRCCTRDFHTNEIKCDVPASISPSMSRIFNAVAIVVVILCLYFPAIFVNSFPDKADISQTISANTQIRNPLYRIANFVVQKIQSYSAENYFANIAKKLLIGFSLPILFYVDWGLEVYTAKCDIPKMFNDAVRQNWQKISRSHKVIVIVVYGISVLITSLLPRTENLFSHLPDDLKSSLQECLDITRQTVEYELNLAIPCSLAKKCLTKCCFGFKGLLVDDIFDDDTSLCWRISKFLFSCFLISIFPVITVMIFTGYFWYTSPLGRTYGILYCNAIINYYWFRCYLEKKRKTRDSLACILNNSVRVCRLIIIIFLSVMTSFLISIISISLILISRFIIYLSMGIVASKDEFLPIIALFSLFAFYISNCFSNVENTYKDLLDQTIDKCKEYQEETKREIIKIDNKGVPRIEPLSDLFQKVVDEIQPFSMAYTKMCLTITIIGCFLCLTYYSILIYGNTSLNDLTKTLAVTLAGLIPRLIDIFRTGTPKELIDKENEYIVRKIVYDFFRDNDNTHAVKEVAIQTENNPPDVKVKPIRPKHKETINKSPSSIPEQQSHHMLVHADVNSRLAGRYNDTSTETTSELTSHQRSTRGFLNMALKTV